MLIIVHILVFSHALPTFSPPPIPSCLGLNSHRLFSRNNPEHQSSRALARNARLEFIYERVRFRWCLVQEYDRTECLCSKF
jgi:hypothetical protein